MNCPQSNAKYLCKMKLRVSFKDIAAQTGLSVATLISRKRYAVLHLRERLRVLKDELLNY